MLTATQLINPQPHFYEQEFNWIKERLAMQLSIAFPAIYIREEEVIARDLTPPQLGTFKIDEHPYLALIKKLTPEERYVLALTLMAYVVPYELTLFAKTQEEMGIAAVLGGVQETDQKNFIPTFQKVLFALTGVNVAVRMQYLPLFKPNSTLFREGILQKPSDSGFSTQAPLRLTDTYAALLLYGEPYQPQYGSAFPASLLTTSYEWEDLILADKVLSQVEEIRDWICAATTIMAEESTARHLKKGYRAILSGKSGTGKTLTASLLGKVTGLPVYRIDVASVVSKYIGETEKNLEQLFQMAEHKNWILFFDEAESLFAKRTATKSSNDQYANQTIGYLLQRIEDYDGIVILSTNKPTNMDDAFTRRFQNIIQFPNPSEEDRLRLWQKVFEEQSLSDQIYLAS